MSALAAFLFAVLLSIAFFSDPFKILGVLWMNIKFSNHYSQLFRMPVCVCVCVFSSQCSKISRK